MVVSARALGRAASAAVPLNSRGSGADDDNGWVDYVGPPEYDCALEVISLPEEPPIRGLGHATLDEPALHVSLSRLGLDLC